MIRRSTDAEHYQVLESSEADFEKMTWTFALGVDQYVTGGHFAIVPVLAFTKAAARLSYAEELLRRAANGDNIQESAEKFFDPEPL